ncbi:MAG TPA: hypothetical protein VLB09_05420, partial [Nitrospiria bacterium]|nr:hypothetical protein [Nitrospiria bacterium]
SVTSHSRLSDKNSYPRKTISDEFIVNSSNNIVLINEAGGEGTVKVFIPEGRYSTGSDLALAFTQRFLPVLTPGTDLLVLFDSISGLFDISVLSLGTGVASVEFLWTSPVTTASDFLGFDSGADSGPLTAGMGIVSNSPHLTAFDQPCGVMSDPSGAEIVVSNRGDDSLVFFSRNADINDRVFPLRILKGPSTGLDEPCGLRWDPVNDLILVANKGNNSIRFFDPSLIIGTADIAPVKVLTGNLTNLEQIAGLDLVNGELIVGGAVGDSLLEVQAAGIPQMTITSSRPDSVASSPLFGNYNTILFGVDYGGVNLNGIPVPVVTSERGEADFDPSGFDPNLNWPFFTSNLITRITREVIEPDCTVVYAEGSKTGYYGTKANGGFFATFPGINGSFQGSVSGDGAFF